MELIPPVQLCFLDDSVFAELMVICLVPRWSSSASARLNANWFPVALTVFSFLSDIAQPQPSRQSQTHR